MCWKTEKRGQVLPRFELWSPDSEYEVLTIGPLHTRKQLVCNKYLLGKMENWVPHSLFSLLNRHISFWGFLSAVWPKSWWAQHETSCTLSKNHAPWTNKPRTTISHNFFVLLPLKDRNREENVTLRWLSGLNGTGDNTLWKLESRHGSLNYKDKGLRWDHQKFMKA
jgi:hypothetical protein